MAIERAKEGRNWRRTFAALAVAGLLAGCGGGDDDEATTASVVGGTLSAAGGLAEPLLAECGTDGFDEPATESRVGGDGATEWRVQYRAPFGPGEPVDPAVTTTVLLIERAPGGSPPTVEGGKEIVVDGTPVSLVSQNGGFVAAWKTDSAFYTGLANGASPKTLKGFIACLP